MNQHIIANRYQLAEELGRGAFGVVYLATDLHLKRIVAVKALHPALVSRDDLFATRFVNEARALAALSHPAIVNVFDVIDHEGHYFIPMAYVAGPTLRDKIKGNRRLPAGEALALLRPLAEAVDYAHQRGVIHRDIKPGNVILDEEHAGRPVLIDFGLAKALAESSTLTQTGATLGTPEYMAPEQADTDRANEVGPATDRYAFGILAYRLLTGEVPFSSDSSVAVALAHIQKPPTPPTSLCPELPPAVDGILLRMLAKTPAERYPSACAFVDDLQAAFDAARREAQLAPLYKRLQTARQRGDYADVLVLGAQIEAIQANYRDVPQVMAQARQQRQAPHATKFSGRHFPVWLWAAGAGSLLLAACLLGLGLREAFTLLSGGPSPTATATATVTAMAIVAQSTATVTSSPTTDTPTSTPPPIETSTAIATSLPPAATETPTATATRTPSPTTTPSATPRLPTATPTPGLEPGSTRTRDADGMTMVYVPAGSFMMGSDSGQADEQPPHQVRLDAFWLDQTEVTNAQFQNCVEAGQCQEPTSCDAGSPTFNDAGKRQHPVVCVNWDGASDYCAWAGGRLPTEAEWEYAARGPDGNTYPWGDESPTCDLAQYEGCEGDTIPVGSLPAGASWVGARDMAGNVWEWVQSKYQDYPYRADDGRENLDSTDVRVLRGGGWASYEWDVRAAYRGSLGPSFRVDAYGFRCVVSPGS